MKVDAPTPEEREKAWRKERQHWPWVGDWPAIEKVITIKEELRGCSPRAEYQHINLERSKFPDRAPRKAAMPDADDEMPYEARIRLAFIRFDQIEVKAVGCGKERPFWSHADFLKLKTDHSGFLYDLCRCNRQASIKCSILDRERGYINEPGDLPEELSYPALCVLTFYDIPDISNPPFPTDKEDCIIYHEEYTNSELAVINEMVNKKYGTIYRTSGKTIKKYREQSIAKPGIVPYCHQTYEGTPIGKLLEDHLIPGRAALNCLFNYFMMFFFKKYTLPHDAPSRENMIRSFMIGPRLQGVDFPKEDLAEKQFDLLVEYGIIKGLKGYTNQKHLLYYATQKSGPHQIPTGPRTNTREYYIYNNQ